MIPLEQLEPMARNVVDATVQGLPDELRAAAQRCQLRYPLEPSAAEDEGLLGLFTGCSLLDGSPENPEELPCITLFLEEIHQVAEGEPAAFREEVKITFLHELGHFLGWDEAAVEARGLA